MHIEIASSPDGDYGPALDAIFADGLASLVPMLPAYWTNYAEQNFLPASDTATASNRNPHPQKANLGRSNDAIIPPKLLNSVEPHINSYAKDERCSGNILVQFWVETDGKTSDFVILRPLGMGLDEDALAAVRQYIFKPATENGAPVRLRLYLDVHLQLH